METHMQERIVIGKYIFELTCEMAPEQYDIHRVHASGDIQEDYAYARLRWGHFQVADEPLGTLIFEHIYTDAYPCFPNDEERMHQLEKAVIALEKYHQKR